MSYQNTPTSNDADDEIAVLLGTTCIPQPTTTAPGFHWNRRDVVVAGMVMLFVVVAGGAAVFMFATTDGGTRMSAAEESVVVATDKFENIPDCSLQCHEVCGLCYKNDESVAQINRCMTACEIDCNGNSYEGCCTRVLLDDHGNYKKCLR